MKIVSKNAAQTKALAARLATRTLNVQPLTSNATVVALVGDLGAGKTTFAQGFAKGLGIKHRVASPTFLIMRPYPLRHKKYELFYHVDVYRINQPSELENLHFRHVLREPHNIVLVEWADKVKKVLPQNTLWIYFEYGRTAKERSLVVRNRQLR